VSAIIVSDMISDFKLAESYSRSELPSPAVYRIIGPPIVAVDSYEYSVVTVIVLTWLVPLPCVPVSLLKSPQRRITMID